MSKVINDMMNDTSFMEFFTQYIETALWSSCDEDDEPLDANYEREDIAPESLERMAADCWRFLADNREDIDDEGRAGHDFWLTRNGHGAGFWDGDWPDDVGERLTEASQRFRECHLYVGDDGRLYCD